MKKNKWYKTENNFFLLSFNLNGIFQIIHDAINMCFKVIMNELHKFYSTSSLCANFRWFGSYLFEKLFDIGQAVEKYYIISHRFEFKIPYKVWSAFVPSGHKVSADVLN